jgi:hypothetical protein
MKNLIIYSGIALVVLANSNNTSFDVKREFGVSQDSKKEMVVNKGSKTVVSNAYSSNSKKVSSMKEGAALKSGALFLKNFSKTTVNKTIGKEEPIEVISTNKINKTADELIAEDNLITENNISNETQALNFNIINSISEGYEVVEPVNISKTEKTVDQLIAEDNLITENNISNETQVLNFNIINSISEGYEVVEPVNISKTKKTADQLIAEDNAITGNNISNETQVLDFEVINKISKP